MNNIQWSDSRETTEQIQERSRTRKQIVSPQNRIEIAEKKVDKWNTPVNKGICNAIIK